MCPPLDDASNPLYNQAVSEQINRLINWPQNFHSARALFSLPEPYSQQELKNYIIKRQNEESYLTQLNVCGYTLWNGGV
ncbi:hypothetical protein ELY21_12850 [Legionella sp. km535]|uniref:hypothetical protein n=1 Tax=Legionella sp. km535 TaxID=2498107 RepID=UPI000F8F2909|nr:hypothetical protein [Legionella sp. km535]RUR16597.1 hypothetical protein ELY21_12850 [Legionella sp. km535]